MRLDIGVLSVGDGCRKDKSEFVEKYMDYIRDRISNIPFSLHDSRILRIEYNKAALTLKLDRIFQFTDDEEKRLYNYVGKEVKY